MWIFLVYLFSIHNIEIDKKVSSDRQSYLENGSIGSHQRKKIHNTPFEVF